MKPALALLEFHSIAVGIEAGDAMIKASPVEGIYAGTVQPGRYLVLVGGDTASVEIALGIGLAAEPSDSIFLPNAHEGVMGALLSGVRPGEGDALGVVETVSVPSMVHAADAGLKAAEVSLATLRIADGLGGKGYGLFSGDVGNVTAACEAAAESAGSALVADRVIASLHTEMAENLWADPFFAMRLTRVGS